MSNLAEVSFVTFGKKEKVVSITEVRNLKTPGELREKYGMDVFNEYCAHYPYMYLVRETNVIFIKKSGRETLLIDVGGKGQKIPGTLFDNIIALMKASGANLGAAFKKCREKKDTTITKYTITI